MPMTAEQLEVAQAQVTFAAEVLLQADLGGYLNHLEHVETVAPILIPTEYRAGMQNVQDQRDLARACREVQVVAERLKARAEVASR